MKVYSDFKYSAEILDVVKLFFPHAELTDDLTSADLTHFFCIENETVKNSCSYSGQTTRNSVEPQYEDELYTIRVEKRYAKVCVYDCLVKATEVKMPWGSLTGIRPTKLAYQLTEEKADYEKMFSGLFGVSEDKLRLIKDILQNQEGIRKYVPDSANLYIGVPFCVSRCTYCSFTSGEIDKLKVYVRPYVEALCRDIDETLSFARQRNIAIRNVYVGGGTPTSLCAKDLDVILSRINFTPEEFTVEAGRPDTIDADKLSVLSKHGVKRISINPQTFNQSVLDTIGRKHSVEEIYDKYLLSKKFGFDVNMDLIAGLPGESKKMFCYSVDCAAELSPENVTVHTLAIKRGSALKEEGYSSEAEISEMIAYAHGRLRAGEYRPYYLYRQKYMSENLENVGFCKEGKQCKYNIDIMEETSDILACGANAISKRIIFGQNRIERAANAKDVRTYIEKNEDYIARKKALYDL